MYQRWEWCAGCPRTEQDLNFLQQAGTLQPVRVTPLRCWMPTWQLDIANNPSGIFLGRQRRRVSSAGMPFWLRRWHWGHWFVMGCQGQEMPVLHFHLLQWRLFSFLIKLSLSWSALSPGLQPWETHSLWVTNSGEEGGLTSPSWEVWWKGHVQNREKYICFLWQVLTPVLI